MTDEQIEKIITEVLRRLLPGLGADGSRGAVIVVFTGATVGINEAVQQVRGLIVEGFQPQLVFSEMAEHLYGPWLREQLAGFPHWSQLPAFTWLRALREARAVVVPMMSVNTLSKLALLIADSQTGNLILHGLFTGKPVIVASNGVETNQGRAELGFDKGFPALKQVVDERLKVIAGYGCKVVDVSRLSAAAAAALPRAQAREVDVAEVATQSPGAGRGVVRHESTLITSGDVLQAERVGAVLQCSARTLITPLARDLAEQHGVRIVREEG
jgi:hypothetical protein